MPKYNNSFASPEFLEETVKDPAGRIIGTIRLKPSSVLWRPANQQSYFKVTLDDFAAWITSCREAKRCKS
jgi:hypothetical protein